MKQALIINGTVKAVSFESQLRDVSWIEVSDDVLPGFISDGVGGFAAPVVSVESWREVASVTRAQFCISLVGSGILPQSEAIEAARGNWPETFAVALASLSDAEETGAQIEWATAQLIHRNHPLIAVFGGSAGMTETQIDALFGWVDE